MLDMVGSAGMLRGWIAMWTTQSLWLLARVDGIGRCRGCGRVADRCTQSARVARAYSASGCQARLLDYHRGNHPEDNGMITKFDSLYAGHVDLDNVGYAGTPINDRRYSTTSTSPPRWRRRSRWRC